MPSLIYVADPLCTWCYGFGPELHTLLQGLPDLKIDIIVGGLRPYQLEAANAETRATFVAELDRVHEATGLPFLESLRSRDDVIYDSEPACRALVTARMIAPESQLPMMQAIQRAFFEEGRQVNEGDVLAEIGAAALAASSHPIDATEFHARWMTQEMIDATAADFMQTRQWDISGFPTLVLARDGRLDLINSGFMRTEQLVARMQAIIDEMA